MIRIRNSATKQWEIKPDNFFSTIAGAVWDFPAGTVEIGGSVYETANVYDYDTFFPESQGGGGVPLGHVHAIADVSGLSEELEGKAAAQHLHGIAGVVGLAGELGSKAPLSHTHQAADLPMQANYLMEIAEPPIYDGGYLKAVKWKYFAAEGVFYEERYQYAAGVLTATEIRDGASGRWIRKTNIFQNGQVSLPEISEILEWSITI